MTSPIHSDWHHYALDKSGAIIHLVRDHEIAREDYYCIGCGKIVRPVMGGERDWHFRHLETNPDCDHESWLHRFAKRYFKEKFESEDSFVVSYWVKETCSRYKNCPLKSDICSSEQLHELNLKQIYDVCEEEKTDGTNRYRADLKFYNSKDSTIKPLFLEIAYKHDCRPEKIASGIQIVELKIEKEEDVEKSIIEPRQLMLDHSKGNPYSFCSPPNIRFYNFERELKRSMSQNLRLFIVFKDDKQMIGHGLLGENKAYTCDKLDIFNHPSILYVLLVTADYMKSNPQFNLWSYGIFKAVCHGITVRNCLICRKCYKGQGGCIRHRNYMENLLDSERVNKDEEAAECRDFNPINVTVIKRSLTQLGNIPCKEIINK